MIDEYDDGSYEEEDDDDEDKECTEIANTDGPMQEYLKAVHKRLQKEVRKNTTEVMDRWLLKILRENEWIIPPTQAKKVCTKLAIKFSEKAYYCKISVWLPDVMYDEQPPCPNMCGNRSCQFHCWRTNHSGRLAVDFYRHYFIISRRHICRDCEKEAKTAKQANAVATAAAAAAASNADGSFEVVQLMPVPKYTFMAWNKCSINQLPDGLGENFPAYLTHRAAIDLVLLDFMRPLFAAGFRPEQMQDLLLELATKHHARQWKKREHEIARRRRRQGTSDEVSMFGEVQQVATSTASIGVHHHRSSSKKKERKAVLGDFTASMPFRLEVPLTMLKRHDPRIAMPESSATPSVEGGAEGERAPMWVRGEPNADDGQLQESEQLAAELSSEEMAEIRLCLAVADEIRDEPDTTGLLDPPPASIVDVFSAVLGDPWHYMDRPKVPVKHEFKKSYFVAFMEAWFAWDPSHLEKVKDALRRHGVSDKDIEAKMYYDIDFFLECCPRVVLPPSILYWRVRAVFSLYGNKIDSVSRKPLFNKRAWKKANNVLKEILKGYASDPPGVAMYLFKIDKHGEIKCNQYGLPLYFCLRGTGLTEAIHKQLLQSIGTCATGVEMSDAVRAEHRHRYNHRMGERRRAGFPLLGHYDTWLVDAIQILVEMNHGVLVYPTWSNGRDWCSTPESMGTIPLQTSELTDAVNGLTVTAKFTREQQYLADQQGVKVCFTPVAFQDERKLFGKLVLEKPAFLDDLDAMALEWVKHVNGKTIFPKLAVYLRTFKERYLKNRRTKTAVEGIEDSINRLKEFNARTLPEKNATDNSKENADGCDELEQDDRNDLDDGCDKPGEQEQTIVLARAASSSWPDPEQLPQLPPPPPPPTVQPCLLAITPRPVSLVGGVQIGVLAPPPQQAKRKQGERSKDRQRRRKRRCTRCVESGARDDEASKCPGAKARVGKVGCVNFDEGGKRKE